MVKECLGPNEAMIRAMGMLNGVKDKVISRMLSRSKDLILVDTPEQSGVFIHRSEDVKFVNYLKNDLKPMGMILINLTIHRFPIEASIALLLSLITQLRSDIPVIPVINKSVR